jgi:hypothetical protein
MPRPRSLMPLGLAAILSALWAGMATAQDLQTLRGADSDGDKAISIAEATAILQQEYGRLDANHDGAVSQDEFVNARLTQLAKLDTDGDGKITRDEVRGFVRNLRPNTP